MHSLCFFVNVGKECTSVYILTNKTLYLVVSCFCSFFLDKDSIGKSRAQVATEFLLELNEDVNGDFVEEVIR